MCGEQKTTWGVWFFLPTMEALGTGLRSSAQQQVPFPAERAPRPFYALVDTWWFSKKKTTLNILSFVILFSWDKTSHWTGSLPFLCYAGSQQTLSILSLLTNIGVIIHTRPSGLSLAFTRALRPELRVSHVCRKYFTRWTVSLAPRVSHLCPNLAVSDEGGQMGTPRLSQKRISAFKWGL